MSNLLTLVEHLSRLWRPLLLSPCPDPILTVASCLTPDGLSILLCTISAVQMVGYIDHHAGCAAPLLAEEQHGLDE